MTLPEVATSGRVNLEVNRKRGRLLSQIFNQMKTPDPEGSGSKTKPYGLSLWGLEHVLVI